LQARCTSDANKTKRTRHIDRGSNRRKGSMHIQHNTTASQLMPTATALPLARRLSVAPMMEWTTRDFRYLVRLLTRHTLLYTEMVTAHAVIHGARDYLLGFDAAEHPVALQLGGSDPAQLAEAARI